MMACVTTSQNRFFRLLNRYINMADVRPILLSTLAALDKIHAQGKLLNTRELDSYENIRFNSNCQFLRLPPPRGSRRDASSGAGHGSVPHSSRLTMFVKRSETNDASIAVRAAASSTCSPTSFERPYVSWGSAPCSSSTGR